LEESIENDPVWLLMMMMLELDRMGVQEGLGCVM